MSANYAVFAFQLVAFIILVALMHDLYRKLRRDESRPAAGPDTAQMRAGVDEMVAELRRAADRINADIVARAGTLQKLVDEADQKLRALDAAVARADASRLPPGRPARPAPVARPAPPAAERSAYRGSSAPSESVLSAGEGPAASAAQMGGAGPRQHPGPLPEGEGTRTGRGAPVGPSLNPQPSPLNPSEPWPGGPASQPTRTMPRVAPAAGAAGSAYRQAARAAGPTSQAAGAAEAEARTRADEFMELGLDDAGKFQAVRRLADQGLSAVEIARQTRLGREEVELIMQLSGEARQ